MFKRLINFLLLANGITPSGHKEKDKWARMREDRERWERERAREPMKSSPAQPASDHDPRAD